MKLTVTSQGNIFHLLMITSNIVLIRNCTDFNKTGQWSALGKATREAVLVIVIHKDIIRPLKCMLTLELRTIYCMDFSQAHTHNE